MVALTVFLTSANDTLLTTARTLVSTAPGSVTTVSSGQYAKNGTGWTEQFSQGANATLAAAEASVPPSGHGFLFDVTTLEGQTVAAGTWTASILLGAVATGFTVTPVMRVFKRSGAGVYTQFTSSGVAQDLTASSQALTTSQVAATFSQALDAMVFASGDKLYIDVLLNITTGSANNTAANRVIKLSENGGASEQAVTPGYGVVAAAALSGSGTLTAGAAITAFAAAAVLTGSGTLTARALTPEILDEAAAGILDEASGVVYDESRAGAADHAAAAALTGSGSLTAAAVADYRPAAALSGTGTLTAAAVAAGAVLRAGSAAVTTGAGSLTLAFTVPSGAQAGDTIAIWVACGFASLTWSVTTGPAFTAQTAASGTSGSMQLFTRVMDGTEGWTPGTSTVTLTISTSHPWDGVIFAAGNAAPDPALSGSGQVNTASLTITVAGVTEASAGDLLVWLGAGMATSGQSLGTITVPAGFTARTSQANSSGVSTSNVGVIMGTATSVPAGATGNENGAYSLAQVNGGLLVSFAVAAAGATAAASLSGSGALTAGAVLDLRPAAALSGSGTLTAGAAAGFLIAAALSGSGTLTSAAVLDARPAAALSGSGTLTAAAALSGAANVAAALSGSGSLTASATAALTAAAALAGTGALTAAATAGFAAATGLSGSGTLTAAVTVAYRAAAALSGTGTLTVIATVTFTARAGLSGAGTLTVAVVVSVPAAAVLAGSGTLTAAAVVLFAAAAVLTGSGALTAVVTVFASITFGTATAGTGSVPAGVTGGGAIATGSPGAGSTATSQPGSG